MMVKEQFSNNDVTVESEQELLQFIKNSISNRMNKDLAAASFTYELLKQSQEDLLTKAYHILHNDGYSVFLDMHNKILSVKW